MKYKVGDHVVVTTGKDRGKSAPIVRIDRKKGKVLLEGLNLKVKHVKGRDGNPGERVEISAPIDISNVAALDPKTKKPTRIGYKVDTDGNKVRYYKASGEVIADRMKGAAAPKAKETSKDKKEDAKTPKKIKA